VTHGRGSLPSCRSGRRLARRGGKLVAAIIGAAGGSGFAYWLESRRRQQEEVRIRVAAINRALFALYRYWNELLPYRQTVLDPFRGKPDAWLNASASVAPIDADQRIDDGNLGFLLDVREGDQFAELILQQDRFRYAAFMAGEHSRTLIDAHQALSARGVERGQGLNDAELTAALGQYLTMRLQVLFAGTMTAIDESLPSFERQFRSLHALGKSLFPEAHFIDVTFTETPPKG
jgi:hypothetical protein